MMMVKPPTSESCRPITGGAVHFAEKQEMIPRPNAWILLPVYLVWTGIIAAYFVFPGVFPFGLIAFILFMLLWMPWWVFHHWDDLVRDRSAVFATIIVAVVVALAMQSGIWWEVSASRNALRLSLHGNHSWVLVITDGLSQIVCVCAYHSLAFIREKISGDDG